MSFQIQDTINLTSQKGDLAQAIAQAQLSTPILSNYKTISAAYTALLTDKIILCTAALTLTLPVCSAANAGLTYTIINTHASGEVTYAGDNVQTAAAGAITVVAAQSSQLLVSNGTVYIKVITV